MVDLHDSLRPVETAPPPPLSEIAARAVKRQRRRFVTATGAVALTVAVGAFALIGPLNGSTDSATVANGAADESTNPSDPADDDRGAPTESDNVSSTVQSSLTERSSTPSTTSTSTTSTSTGPPDEATSLSTGSTIPTSQTETGSGLRIEETRTSEWDDGYCVQIELTNDAGDVVDWEVSLDVGGTIDTIWNATAIVDGDRTVFSGLDGQNTDLLSGQTTSFGACINTDPNL